MPSRGRFLDFGWTFEAASGCSCVTGEHGCQNFVRLVLERRVGEIRQQRMDAARAAGEGLHHATANVARIVGSQQRGFGRSSGAMASGTLALRGIDGRPQAVGAFAVTPT